MFYYKLLDAPASLLREFFSPMELMAEDAVYESWVFCCTTLPCISSLRSPTRLNKSDKRAPFTLKSRAESVLKDGLRLTSRSQGLNSWSSKMSKPSNSKQLLFFFLMSLWPVYPNWYWLGTYISTPFQRRVSADMMVLITISLIWLKMSSKLILDMSGSLGYCSFIFFRYSLNAFSVHLDLFTLFLLSNSDPKPPANSNGLLGPCSCLSIDRIELDFLMSLVSLGGTG